MSARITKTLVAASLMFATASAAVAQRQVDTRLNLSTQPIYSSYDRRPINMDYARASSLMASGNIRGGKALMINRNFLEDRYFSGSLTRFYRDTTGVQDVRGGMSYGVARPYFRPGSLTTSYSSLQTRQYRSADPFGSVPQAFGSGSSPFSVTYTPPASTQPVFYRAQFPAQYNLGSIRSEFTPDTTGYNLASFLSRYQVYQGTLTQPGYGETRVDTTGSTRVNDRWSQVPYVAPVPGMDNLSLRPEAGTENATPLHELQNQPIPELQRFATPEAQQGEGQTQTPAPYAMGLRQSGEPTPESDYEEAPPEYLFPENAADILLSPGRQRNLDEQYYQLGLLDLDAGAYEQAAEAFRQSGTLNIGRGWEVGRYEAWSWLLGEQFHRAANLINQTLKAKPEAIDPAFRLTTVVDRAEDWQKAEKALLGVLSERPDSPAHAFVLAYLRIFLGRADEARDLLPVAEKNRDFAEAVKLLREKTMP